MTREQANERVTELVAAWPWASWPDATLALYRHQFEGMRHADLAAKVVEKAVHTLDRPPSVRWLRDEYAAVAKTRDWQPPAVRRELPPSSLPPLDVIGDVLAGSEIGRWLLERRRAAGDEPDEPKDAA